MKQFLRPFLGLLAVALISSATAAESLDQTINYLITYIAKSDATFIRNGEKHAPAEGAEHVRAKYEHFKKEIKTPEDFIRLAASKSLLSGKPYLVIPKGEKERHLDEWLTEALQAHRAGAAQ
ncbi:MAG: DUF5329 family protein [Chthoniobacterales bacterium]